MTRKQAQTITPEEGKALQAWAMAAQAWAMAAMEDCVQRGHGCPACHERRVDYLVWHEDGIQLTCQTCEHTYTL